MVLMVLLKYHGTDSDPGTAMHFFRFNDRAMNISQVLITQREGEAHHMVIVNITAQTKMLSPQTVASAKSSSEQALIMPTDHV